MKNLTPLQGYAIFVAPSILIKGMHVLKLILKVNDQGCDAKSQGFHEQSNGKSFLKCWVFL